MPITFLIHECAVNSERRVWSEGSIFIPCHGGGWFRKDENEGPSEKRGCAGVIWPWSPDTSVICSVSVNWTCVRTHPRSVGDWIDPRCPELSGCEDRLVSLVSRGYPEATTLHTDNRWIDKLGPTGVLLVVYLTLSIALIMDDWSVGTGEWFTLCLPLFRDGVVTTGRRSSDLLHKLTFKWNDWLMAACVKRGQNTKSISRDDDIDSIWQVAIVTPVLCVLTL